MAVRDAPLEPARCRAGRNRTSEAGDLGFPAGGGEFWNGGGGVGGHWEKRRRVRREEKQPGDGDSGSTINGCSSQQAARWALLPHTRHRRFQSWGTPGQEGEDTLVWLGLPVESHMDLKPNEIDPISGPGLPTWSHMNTGPESIRFVAHS